jgi:hypothetical protein
MIWLSKVYPQSSSLCFIQSVTQITLPMSVLVQQCLILFPEVSIGRIQGNWFGVLITLFNRLCNNNSEQTNISDCLNNNSFKSFWCINVLWKYWSLFFLKKCSYTLHMSNKMQYLFHIDSDLFLWGSHSSYMHYHPFIYKYYLYLLLQYPHHFWFTGLLLIE